MVLIHIFLYQNKLYKNNEAGKIKNKNQNEVFIFFKKIYLQKNDPNTFKVIFCDVIGYSIGL